MNKVFLIGNLTKNPEKGETSNGKMYVHFSIAVNGYNKRVDFFNCFAWDKKAELIITYCEKGSKVAICGELRDNTYEDNQGIKRHSVEILVNDIDFIGKSTKVAQNGTDKLKEGNNYEGMTEVHDDDLPF